MATLIPSLNSCLPRMTGGEKRLARALEHQLDDDYLLWYDVPIGKNYLHPDFIILHPGRGLFILEVKDWKLETLERVTRTTVTLLTPDGVKDVKNPLRQARDYALAVCKILERDAALVSPIGNKYQGKLIFPYGYGVVLTNIPRKALEKTDLAEIFEPRFVLCNSDLTQSTNPEEFQQRIWDLATYQFGSTLTGHQIDRIRWHIFPDLRIGAKQLSLFPEPSSELEEETIIEVKPIEVAQDLIKIMDLQQEQLARSLGDGHRVIHGVAGSGKTLILVYRCQYLAQTYSKPILCLCFNVSLASKLRQMITEKQVNAVIIVRHFHGWCVDVLKNHKLPLPDSRLLHGEAYVQDLVNRVIQGIDQGAIPAGQYGAIVIDEGHDFQPEWLKLTTTLVDPETNSLLVLYDDASAPLNKWWVYPSSVTLRVFLLMKILKETQYQLIEVFVVNFWRFAHFVKFLLRNNFALACQTTVTECVKLWGFSESDRRRIAECDRT